MTIKRSFTALSFLLFFASFSSCELADEITKSQFDRDLANISNVWKVDSIRVQEYGLTAGNNGADLFLVSNTSLPVTKMEFLRVDKEALGGQLFQTSIENGNEIVTELKWFYREEYLDLYFPNPAIPGVFYPSVIFTMVEISDKKFVFNREENIVNDISGEFKGKLASYYYLSR